MCCVSDLFIIIIYVCISVQKDGTWNLRGQLRLPGLKNWNQKENDFQYTFVISSLRYQKQIFKK